MVQVCLTLGAGGITSWGPAPQNGAIRTTVAQVFPSFLHLRHIPEGPAPETSRMAGVLLFWRRYVTLLAQVYHCFGAGGIIGWGPAPQNGAIRTTVAQVFPSFPHLRHIPEGPAPETSRMESFRPNGRICLGKLFTCERKKGASRAGPLKHTTL